MIIIETRHLGESSSQQSVQSVHGNQPPSHQLWSASGAETRKCSALSYFMFLHRQQKNTDGGIFSIVSISSDSNSNTSYSTYVCVCSSCTVHLSLSPFQCILKKPKNTRLAFFQWSKSCSTSAIRWASLSSSSAVRRIQLPALVHVQHPHWQWQRTRAAAVTRDADHCDKEHHRWDEMSTRCSPAAAQGWTLTSGMSGRIPPGRCFQMELLAVIRAVFLNCKAEVGVRN